MSQSPTCTFSCHFPCVPSIPKTTPSPQQLSWFFLPFPNTQLLHLCSAVTNRGELQDVPLHNDSVSQKMERFPFCYRAAAEYLWDILVWDPQCWGAQTHFVYWALQLTRLEIILRKLIPTFRSQGSVERWQLWEKSLNVPCHRGIFILSLGLCWSERGQMEVKDGGSTGQSSASTEPKPTTPNQAFPHISSPLGHKPPADPRPSSTSWTTIVCVP